MFPKFQTSGTGSAGGIWNIKVTFVCCLLYPTYLYICHLVQFYGLKLFGQVKTLPKKTF